MVYKAVKVINFCTVYICSVSVISILIWWMSYCLNWVLPEQIFSEIFGPLCSHYKGQRHEDKSVHVSGPEGTTVVPLILLATGSLKMTAERNAECSSKTRVEQRRTMKT